MFNWNICYRNYLFIFMITALTANILEVCPPNWDFFNGMCYNRTDERLNFTEAENKCESWGGFLTSIVSEEEMTFLRYLR